MADGFELHRSRRGLFGDDAVSYEHGRPPYPARVFELLRASGALRPGCRVLEIGPGTGQATVELLDAGAHVTAIELSDVFADRLEDRFAGAAVTVLRGPFEAVELPAASFDLVVAATSFHWIVPTHEGMERAAEVLRPGGWLVLWWNVFGDASRPDPFGDALDELLRHVEPTLADRADPGNPFTSMVPYAQDEAARVAEFDATGRFDAVRHELISWTGRHDASELRSLFASFSPWLALSEERRGAALDHLGRLAVERFGGVVERPYQTPVYLARRR